MDLTRPRPEPEPEPGPIYQSGPKRGSTLGFFGWSIFCVFIWIKEIKKKKEGPIAQNHVLSLHQQTCMS